MEAAIAASATAALLNSALCSGTRRAASIPGSMASAPTAAAWAGPNSNAVAKIGTKLSETVVSPKMSVRQYSKASALSSSTASTHGAGVTDGARASGSATATAKAATLPAIVAAT